MAYVERQRGGRHRKPMREREVTSGWTAVCELGEIEPGRGVVRHVNGTEVAIMRDGDRVFALGNLWMARKPLRNASFSCFNTAN